MDQNARQVTIDDVTYDVLEQKPVRDQRDAAHLYLIKDGERFHVIQRGSTWFGTLTKLTN